MTGLDRIEYNPKVCNGKPVIGGTRIPVSVILGQIAQGESWDDLLRGYPELEKEDIKAALHTRIFLAYPDKDIGTGQGGIRKKT